jgi:excisionase family DNA binding protein
VARDASLTQQTISIPEAARLLGISPRSAYRAANAGELPAIRIRGRIVVPTHRLLEMLNGEAAHTRPLTQPGAPARSMTLEDEG